MVRFGVKQQMISRLIIIFSICIPLIHGNVAAVFGSPVINAGLDDGKIDFSPAALEKTIRHITPLIGPNDAILIAEPGGKLIFSRNADKPCIPASTLKVLTSLAAFHYLGEDYRFPTHFYLDEAKNLTIKGFGDPLLISEEIDIISRKLKVRLRMVHFCKHPPDENTPNKPWLNDLILDDTYIKQSIRIPGRNLTLEPYDAPNGALCVNFNTVFFKTSGSRLISAEPQTPLLPLAVDKIKNSGLNQGRITLTHRQGEIVRYTGEMFRYFLEKQSLQINGKIRSGVVMPDKDRMILAHESSQTIETVVSMLLEYSNNFIANQLLLAMGAKTDGAPATLEKGITAVTRYAAEQIGISGFQMVEGAGLSRNNQITANGMLKILEAFAPHYKLMPRDGSQYYKTGTLTGISTRIGYVVGKKTGRRYRFVVFFNSSGKSSAKVADLISSTLSQ